MFHRVLIITCNGRQLFFGATSALVPWLRSNGHPMPHEHYNPAEFVTDLVLSGAGHFTADTAEAEAKMAQADGSKAC